LAPESVVVPAVVVRLAAPPSPLMAPPVELTAPLRMPFCNVPPASETLLMVCAKPPRSSVPPLLTVVALAAANAFAAPPFSVPPFRVVAPV